MLRPTGGGHFGATGVGTFLTLNPGWRYTLNSTSATKRTLTATIRATALTLVWSISIGDQPTVLDGDSFESVSIDTGDVNVVYVVSFKEPSEPIVPFAGGPRLPRNTDGSILVGGISNGLKQLEGNGHPLYTAIDPGDLQLLDNQTWAGTLTAATGETVEQAGAVALTPGALIYYDLSNPPGTTADGATAVYIALKGEVSNFYYAVCAAGSKAGIARAIMPEKVDIVARNAGASTHYYNGSWASWNGV